MMKKLLILTLPLALCACGSPQEEFESIINDQGYIAYKTPLGTAAVGSIVKGQKDNLRLAANPQRCFPDHYKNNGYTHMRWQTDTVLPNQFRSINVGIGIDLSPLTSFANPLLGINAGVGYAKSVQIKFEGASVEYLDEVAFKNYYDSEMNSVCKQFVQEYPFISQALKINKMTYTFKDSWGAEVKLTPGVIGDMLNIGAGVEYEMKNDYELVIKTPKYIGYQVAQFDSGAPGYIGGYAKTTDRNGNFIFRPAANDSANVQSLSLRYPAPALPALEKRWGEDGSGEYPHSRP